MVSPLTTLVQTVIEGAELTRAAAEVQVRAQTGLTMSLFDDDTKGNSADQVSAGTLARLIVVTTQQQLAAQVGTIASNAIDGSKITKEKLDQAIQKRLLERLPVIAAAVPAIVAAAPADKASAFVAQ